MDGNTTTGRVWLYKTDTQAHCDDDVRKTAHYAVNQQTGECREIDYSPYRFMTPEIFGLYVALGFPPRAGLGSITDAEIINMASVRLMMQGAA